MRIYLTESIRKYDQKPVVSRFGFGEGFKLPLVYFFVKVVDCLDSIKSLIKLESNIFREYKITITLKF